MNIQIHSIHFTADQKLKELIEQKSAKLEKVTDRIIDCEVFLKLDNNASSVREKIAEIKIKVPGNSLFASAESKSFEESFDSAQQSISKQLKKWKEKAQAK